MGVHYLNNTDDEEEPGYAARYSSKICVFWSSLIKDREIVCRRLMVVLGGRHHASKIVAD